MHIRGVRIQAHTPQVGIGAPRKAASFGSDKHGRAGSPSREAR